MLQQGDLYWIDLGEPIGSEPGYLRPHVVVQNDVMNRTRINSVMLCPLSTNLRRAGDRGNVVLEPGEGGLAQQSGVLVAQVVTLDFDEGRGFIGRLSPARMRQIVQGIVSVIELPNSGTGVPSE